MAAALPIIAAVTAASAIYGGVEQNQQIQHAKGAAEAEETRTKAALADQKATDQQATQMKANQGSSTQAAAMAALRSAMSGSSGMGGSILTSPTGTPAAPTLTKTLLGA